MLFGNINMYNEVTICSRNVSYLLILNKTINNSSENRLLKRLLIIT